MSDAPLNKSELAKRRWEKVRAWFKHIVPFVISTIVALILLLLYNSFVVQPHQLTPAQVNTAIADAMASATPPPPFSEQVYKVIQPSLVLIQTQGPHGGGTEYGLGSGVVVDETGSILTSLHVVDGAQQIKVTFADGTESSAEIVVRQPENDIAVIHSVGLPSVLVPAVLGNANAMQVGDEAFVVGNPFGLYSSMSSGVISGFNRTFKPTGGTQELQGLIQIDAAVNPGNSGGPLLNRYGHVIGIVTGIINPTEANFFVGIGFAVPIQVAVSGMGSPPY
jgi:S1-C subfamily serine protease